MWICECILVMIFRKTKVFHILPCCKVKMCPNIWWCMWILVLCICEIVLKKIHTYFRPISLFRISLFSLPDRRFFRYQCTTSSSDREGVSISFSGGDRFFRIYIHECVEYSSLYHHCLDHPKNRTARIWDRHGESSHIHESHSSTCWLKTR